MGYRRSLGLREVGELKVQRHWAKYYRRRTPSQLAAEELRLQIHNLMVGAFGPNYDSQWLALSDLVSKLEALVMSENRFQDHDNNNKN